MLSVGDEKGPYDMMDYVLRLGMKCNFNCSFCNIMNHENIPEKTFEEVKREVENLNPHKLGTISISGGEPTLSPFLGDLIEYLFNRGFRVNLQTNAVLITPQKAKDLKKKGLSMVFVNFPSHLPETYARLTGTNLKMFEKGVEGILNLLSEDITVILNIVINQENFSKLNNYLQYVSDKFSKIKEINFSVIQPHGNAAINSHLIPDYRDLKPFFKSAFKTAQKLGLKIINPYCGLPLCMLWDLLPLENNSEYLTGMAVRRTQKVPSLIKIIYENKIQPDSCYACCLKNICMGIWKAYYKIKGDIVEPPYRALRFWPKD